MEVIILFDKNYPNHFDLMSYSDATANIQVLNLNEIEDVVWLRLPAEISVGLTLSDFSEVTMDVEAIDYTDHIVQDTNRVWYKVDTSILNTSAGYHLYKLTFSNSKLDNDFCLYFGYQIQTNAPERPYIYMKDR